MQCLSTLTALLRTFYKNPATVQPSRRCASPAVIQVWIDLFPFTARYNINRRIAPPIASRRLPTLNPVTSPSPRNDPINPPRKAPAIPSKIVTMNPPGSLPGMRNFARTPTINPITIQDRIPMAKLLCNPDSVFKPSR